MRGSANQLQKLREKPEIRRFRRILEAHRDDVLKALSRLESERLTVDSEEPQDSADQSINSISKESLFQRSSDRRRLLRMIDAAVLRIENGTFGLCVGCGDEINPRRLDALPWTQYCLHCQEDLERNKGRGSYPEEEDQIMNWRKAG